MVEQKPNQSNPTAGGGIELHRGMEHERAATIYHLLLRLLHYPSARVTIESHEDSTITWTDDAGVSRLEDVQCKKIERSAGPQSLGMDDWSPGTLNRDRFRDYLTEKRRGESSIGRLAGHPERFFTLIAYAEPVKATRKFIPPGVVHGGFTRGPATREYFPADYRFPADPDQNSDIGTEDERRRIRVVFLGVPQLRSFAYIMLSKLYGVWGGKAADAFESIERLLYHHLFRNGELRTFGLQDIETAIQAYVAGMGKWENVSALISVRDERPTGLPFVSWSDLQAGKLIKSDILRQGLDAFAEDSFVTISGYHGCGKTVLCKYLAWTFLEQEPEGKCFYLQASPGDNLSVELEMFQAALAKPWLFIVDDAHFADDQVDTLCQAYLDRALTHKVTARLVVATTDTSFSAARRGLAVSPLDEARLLRFDFLSEEVMRSHLVQHRANHNLERVNDSAILRIAGGDEGRVNFGVALIIAHAAESDLLESGKQITLESPQVRASVAKWIAALLQIPPQDFETFVAPVFTAGSFGLPVTVEFNKCIVRLAEANFLVADPAEPGFLKLRSEYASLAWIVSRQHLHDHGRIFLNYLRDCNSQAPRLAQALASDDVGRRTLQDLLDNHLHLFLPQDRSRGVDFEALASIITAARRVSPTSASHFMRLCFREGEGSAFTAPIVRASVLAVLRTDVRPLARFLRAAYSADRVFAQRLGTILIDNHFDLYELFQAFNVSPSSIGDLLYLLREAKNCDRRFATLLAPQLAETDRFKTKWDEVADSGDPAAMVRALTALKAINRHLFIDARDRHLTEAQLSRWIEEVRDISRFAEFLVGVRRLSARTSSQTLRVLLSRRRGEIMSLVLGAAGIGDSSALISSIARIDRRLATPLARDCSIGLGAQVARETSYSRLGEGLGRLGQSTTPTFAAEIAEHLPVSRIAESMQKEKRRFDLIGRTLARLAAVAPRRAGEIAEALDYREIYERIRERPLMNLTQLTRGLLLALPIERHEEVQNYIRGDHRLSALFHDSLFQERSLRQLADALSTLVSAGLSADKIYELFGADQVAFKSMIGARMTRTGASPEYDLEVASFLFALAQLGPNYASEALATYTEVLAVSKPASTTEQVGSRLQRRLGGTAAARRARGKFVDTAAAGALLHVASAIDDASARVLLEARSSAFQNIGSDRNLGRQAVLILGVHDVSRTECRSILRNVYTADRLEQMFEAPDNPRELIQFLYSIQIVSVSECQRIASFLASSSADDFRDYLNAEVDLHELSRWIMTFAAIDRSQLADFRALAAVCAEYDTRLWALIDAAQAMIAFDARDAALVLGGAIRDSASQARNVRKLSHCVQLWLKAQYVADALRDSSIILRLGEVLLPQVIRLMAHDNDSVSIAFALRLWCDNEHVSAAQRARLTEYRSLQIFRLTLGEQPLGSALAAILLKAPGDRLDACLAKVAKDESSPWASGLLQLALDAYCPSDWAAMVDTTPVPAYYNNLKYGLACYAKLRAHGSISVEEVAELAIRKADETSAAVRALLQPAFDAAALRTRPYYFWTYLRRTLLALEYLDWQAEIDRAVSAAMFNKRYSISPNPMLDAAE